MCACLCEDSSFEESKTLYVDITIENMIRAYNLSILPHNTNRYKFIHTN